MIVKLVLPIILQFLGVAVILAEFMIPSAGILSISALAVFGYSLYLVYSQISPHVCVVFAVADAVMIPVLIWAGVRILASSPMALKKTLAGNKESSVQTDFSGLVNKDGIVITTLRPAGKAEINDRKYDVVSTGDFLNKGEEIIVTNVSGNRIVVRKK